MIELTTDNFHDLAPDYNKYFNEIYDYMHKVFGRGWFTPKILQVNKFVYLVGALEEHKDVVYYVTPNNTAALKAFLGDKFIRRNWHRYSMDGSRPYRKHHDFITRYIKARYGVDALVNDGYALYKDTDVHTIIAYAWDVFKTRKQNTSRIEYKYFKPLVHQMIATRRIHGILHDEVYVDLKVHPGCGLYGNLITYATIQRNDDGFDELKPSNVKVITTPVLTGEANPMLYGSIEKKYGVLNNELIGDVSGIEGDITNLYGDATGITLRITKPLLEPTDVRHIGKAKNSITFKHKVLTNEQNQHLMKVWRRLAHCTLGLTDEERALIDNPKKFKPPFPVDKYGRHYEYDDTGNLWIYSVNPMDIMLLKDTNRISTCFCLNSIDGINRRWGYGMRCLIVPNCINKGFGCVFRVHDANVKVMRQFKDVKFHWFDPEAGAFIQYDDKGNCAAWWNLHDPLHVTERSFYELHGHNIPPIHGHDGINDDHTRQEGMAYLELNIKPDYSYAPEFKPADGEMIIANNYGGLKIDKDFNILDRAGKITFDENNIIEEAKKIKGVLDGQEI